ncbi:MAG: hypothetical protein HWE27_04930 [Gammaproteobacteria bacterium]|nr:hypothetical protein [Gammaproteobacteria bacterium]
MKIKYLVGMTAFTVSAMFAPATSLMADDGQETVMMVCQNTGDKAGFDSKWLNKFIDQCAGDISGLTFSSDDPVSGEEISSIEERCVDASESEDEEEFERNFGQCMVSGVLQALKDSAE